MSIALNRQHERWTLVGLDDASSDALDHMTTGLITGLRFPAATTGVERYHWSLVGEIESVRRRWGRARRGATRSVAIDMDVLDPPGESFASGRAGLVTRAKLVDALVESRGIVYLFDPLREFEKGDAFDHLHGALIQLGQRMLERNEFTGGRLPHHVAICIAKYDEIRVLETARRMQLATVDPDDPLGFPRVDDDEAFDLFKVLCGVSARGDGELIYGTLEKYFHPSRIRYFASSAVGFYVDPRVGAYNPDDFQNVFPDSTGLQRIRGSVHPINVAEPVLWLGRSLAAEQEA
ncbi:hypothetical protein [Actinoallomurus iriomotensis]|uniref:hypothetical protein n=1 Tax=Actinoallomurus iriomotensis TaxID=478107 RepID=UPI0025575B7A|nr:hypothetical protein [Actinoallomurus iriomotensis]